ncbi:MAG: DUF4199 family protein [Bacteroidota bacterium]
MERKNFPILLALVWLLIKSGLKFSDFYDQSVIIGIGLNLLILPFVVLFAIKPFFNERGHSGIFLAKQAMKSGGVYVVCVALGIFIYYQFIDPEYRDYVEKTRTKAISDEIEKVGGIEEFHKAYPMSEGKSEEELIKEELAVYENLTPFKLTTFSLLCLMILAIFYSFLMAILFKVLNRH